MSRKPAKALNSDAAPALANGHALPKGWRMVRFGDVVRDVNEAERNPLDAGLERFVGLEHIEPENLHLKKWGNLADGEVSFTKRFRKGQLLFGKRRAYQRKVAIAEFDGICSSDILTFEPKGDDLLPELLPFIVQSEGFFEHALGTSSGSLSPRTRWSQLQDYEFPLPPKDEQRRIAELLSVAMLVVESWRDVRSRFCAAARAYREQCVMSDKFTRVRLGECLEQIVPGDSVIGRNEAAAGDDFGVLKVSAVGADGFVPEENKTLLNSIDFQSEFAVREGDLLITRSNTPDLVGRSCLVPKDFPKLMLCDKTLKLVPNGSVCSKALLLEVLRSDSVRAQIKGFANGTGGAMKNISQHSIRSIRIPLPDEKMQLQIDRAVRSMSAARAEIDSHLERSTALFKAIREEILMGRSHVQ